MRTYLDRKFFQKLFVLAIPVSLQFLLHSSRYIADMFMIGQIGEHPLAAVGLCTNIHMLFNSIIWGGASGIGILCAQYFGAQQTHRLGRTVNLGVAAGIIVMLPLSALLFFKPAMLMAIGTNHAQLISLGSQYLRITAILPVGIALVAGVGAGLNAMGKPHLNFLFTAVAVLSNIFLNWVLIFGHLGAPAMGIEGAALATLASVAIEVVFILVYLSVSNSIIRVSMRRIRESLERDAVKQFLRISLPLTIGGLVWHTGTFVYQAFYGHLGASELAVISMVQPVRTIMFAFFWGISSATGVIMGHHLGAGEFHHAWYRSLVLIGLGVIAAIVAVVVVWTGESTIFSFYDRLTPETIASARSVLFTVLITTPILAANVVGIVGVLQSGADTRFVLVMDVFCQWAVGIPLCYLAAFHYNLSLDLVFLAAFCEEIVKLFIWVPRFVSRIWIRRLVHELPA